MTSTANQQNVPAPNPSTAPSAASYATAAGASKKPAATPVIATGSNAPVVVGSTATAPQHAKSSSISPLNGSKPPNMAAVPVASTPAVAYGSHNVNGNPASHDRKSSVTYTNANGGPVGGPKQAPIKFGFDNSPAPKHSTPQAPPSGPMAIPGTQQLPVPSPTASPSPIPQPAASGGRPPSSIGQEGTGMKFGSLGGDGERHMKHLSQNTLPGSPHIRHSSTHSTHNEMGNHGGQGPTRGGFQPQGGRGRGGYNNNPQFANPNMGYPPAGGPSYPRGPGGQGRGNIPFRPQAPIHLGSTNSPRAMPASPAMQQSMPNNGTPSMQQSMPVQPPNYQYAPPMGYHGQVQQNYSFNPYEMRGSPMMGFPNYQQMPQYINAPSQSPSPAFAHPYQHGQYPPPVTQPMSRNPSQVSERPNSSASQPQAPVIVQSGTPQPSVAQVKPPAVVSSTYQKAPRESKAILIKNAQGEVLDLKNLKASTSPAPSAPQQPKTPPVVASTPTPPPPKPATPSHTRTESNSIAKSTEQVRKEFKEQFDKQVRKTADDPAPAGAADESVGNVAEPVVAEKPASEAKEPVQVEEKVVEEPKAPSPKEEAKATVTEKPDDEEPPLSPLREEDMPNWTDEQWARFDAQEAEKDAKEEARQAQITAEKKVQAEETKKREEAERKANAAEEERKLKEAEREAERIEEERERERERKEAAGSKGLSVAEMLARPKDADALDQKDSTPSTPDALAAKVSELKISGPAEGPSSATPSETASVKSGTEKQRPKPSALNLTPLNTKTVEPPQPSAALQSLKTARFLNVIGKDLYPAGVSSPNPALNSAVTKKGNFKYDTNFLLQFKGVFTEKPSVDFEQQLKNLMGDGDGSRSAVRTPATGSGRQNSRTAAGGFPQMGSMGSFGAKTLPPGTTSAERFAMSSGALPRPPIGAFNRPGGAFPGPSQMSRTPSSSNMGNMPNSPRQGSRSTRGGSKRDNYNAKAEAQAAKTMPLTQGQDLKPIVTTSTGWKPTSVGNRGAANPALGQEHLDPSMVQRKVKAALNKMTPENFDKISQQILAIALQSKDEEDGRTLRQVIQLTFEKATDEAHWAAMYAKFCHKMLVSTSPEIRDTTILDKNGNVVNGGALFRKYLLNRCQEEFERGWKTDLPQPKEGESKEAAMLSDEYYLAAAAKRRGLGLVQFIGELYKLGMLTERIMHECVRKLVDYNGTPDEAEIESLSKLLRTIGANLDATEKGKLVMDAYFNRIQNIIDLPDLPSRLKFMLMDVVDLRRTQWAASEANKGPKTLDEVRQEAELAAAQKAAEASRSNQRGGPGGRPTVGRGDARQFSSYSQPQNNQVGMDDLRRLKGASAGRTMSSGMTLGPTSMFASRSNSGRRIGPGGALSRAGEESGASSRTGTPPTRDQTSHANAFHVLANMETENPASPPSTAASPALARAVPDTSAASSGAKDGE